MKLKESPGSPNFEKLRRQFTEADLRCVCEALDLDYATDLANSGQHRPLDCYTCGMMVLTDPRLRSHLATFPKVGLSPALYYGAQVFAAFRESEIRQNGLALALTLKLIETIKQLHPKLSDHEPLPPLNLSITTQPQGHDIAFSVEATLPGAMLVLDGTFEPKEPPTEAQSGR